jgi:hypothetical protein
MDATAEVLRHLPSHQKADETLVQRVARKINGDDNEHDDDGGPDAKLAEALLGHEPDYHDEAVVGILCQATHRTRGGIRALVDE